MSNKPANRPGHPIHGFNRRFVRSAKKRRQMQIAWNQFRNQMFQPPEIKGLHEAILDGEAQEGKIRASS